MARMDTTSDAKTAGGTRWFINTSPVFFPPLSAPGQSREKRALVGPTHPLNIEEDDDDDDDDDEGCTISRDCGAC